MRFDNYFRLFRIHVRRSSKKEKESNSPLRKIDPLIPKKKKKKKKQS